MASLDPFSAERWAREILPAPMIATFTGIRSVLSSILLASIRIPYGCPTRDSPGRAPYCRKANQPGARLARSGLADTGGRDALREDDRCFRMMRRPPASLFACGLARRLVMMG